MTKVFTILSILLAWATGSAHELCGQAELLAEPVSRTEYLLGPGDSIQIAVFGDVDTTHLQGVSPDGRLLVPGMGIVSVLGLNLEQAQAQVRDVVLSYFRNVTVSVNLFKVRSFRIYVVGSVENPGVRIASSAMRVSEVVPGVGPQGAIPRNIRLQRINGDSLRIDLARFFHLGDLTQNPSLREGDLLVVPSPDRRIEVYGPVAYPGTYEFRPGETLAELLSVVNGGAAFPVQAADSIRVARFTGNTSTEVITLPRAEALGSSGKAFELQPFDAIYVPEVANYRQQKTATIVGQVRRPGTYPIRSDTTTVRELVELAGGFLPEASLVNASLRRSTPPLANSGGTPLQEIPPEFLSERERRVVQSLSSSDQNNVVIDFYSLFAEGAEVYNQTLRSGDVLSVPEVRNEVLVSGAVIQPGIVQFLPDQPLQHFIGLAGGYGRNADVRGLVVIKASTGARVGRGDVRSIEPGDQIVVPYREPRSLLQRVEMTQGIFNTISGIVLAAIGLSRLF
jgi:protein involved in polysaccharide export with SLBB domain